ncbi:MAG: LLM class flavin-dependent oxidoreductase [Chloroflexota bacterium]|nr:LLM class flavin-dependent oxidoreductase [Chloroflexota bacterium]
MEVAVTQAPKLGFCVPLFANPGAAFFRTPAWTELDPRLAVDAACEAEQLGFDSVWVADHLMHGHDGGIMEGWTTLSVIAGRTSRVELGSIHMAQPFRAPSLTAKMVATLDALSGGRLIFFYDCGWQEAEVRAYGLDWPAEDERIARMEEGLRLIDALWKSDAPVSFAGRYFHTRDAICRPKPARYPPLWLGEARHDAWVDAICRHMVGWNSTPASPARLAEKLELVRDGCARVGRDFSELEVSLETQVLIAPTEDEARSIALRIADLPPSPRGAPRRELVEALRASPSRPLAELVDDWLIGTPESVEQQMRAYMDLGVSHFMLWFLDFPQLDGMRLFAERVAPALRTSA